MKNNYVNYECVEHTYRFHERPFIYHNRKYRSGFYDENGKYYRNVEFTNAKSPLYCSLCKRRYVTNQKYCPNCGNDFKVDKTDSISNKQNSASILLNLSVILLSVSAILMFTLIIHQKFYNKVMDKINSFTTINSIETETEKKEEPVYFVKKLNREVQKTGINTYYDAETECYFKFDTDASPSQWYYYFKGISDQYTDYGWMSYNKYNNRWMIKTADKYWEVLDQKYLSDRLWYFSEMCNPNVFETEVTNK